MDCRNVRYSVWDSPLELVVSAARAVVIHELHCSGV